ncbi:MAG: hypothetical protein ACPGSB_07260, partial [Opitutales bacterium]
MKQAALLGGADQGHRLSSGCHSQAKVSRAFFLRDNSGRPAKVIPMFTGIVEETGKVISFESGEKAWRLLVEAEEVVKDLKLGDSVAVNGCCLTVVAFEGQQIAF